MEKPVNIYTEWAPLLEVIVGDYRNITIPKNINDVDISFREFYYENVFDQQRNELRTKLNIYAADVRKYPDQIEEERAEDIDNLARLLDSCGIVVRRPKPLDNVTEIRTPLWCNVSTPCGNVRDQFMVLGDEIIETPPLIRGRYFENDLVKDHLLEYFKRGARWTIAPRPLMIDESFDRSYSGENPTDTDISKFEIMFDGAQCVKFGRDIVMNAVNENHRLGAVWLERHLGGRFRVHQVEITDNHIDGHLLPLRPGTLLVKQAMFDQWNRLPKGLQSWDAIIFADEEILNADSKETPLASKYISMNVLSIDPERVIISDQAPQTIRSLEKAGFTPIPTRLRHSRLYTGGFHCATLDIRRDEELETYF
ncbi:MAG: glycine amidinotransferase [Mesorhizobium sp.]|uniref:hypothetical protein n=1 Tax=Mesorhizobium sp. TaxID=1871066 RepID=UPI000FE870C0|nr:hypothetical protein [Mesorhizobium sp.]RWI47990.1 MAG: glycine amidinotransferase [Mesorhizobium sp.]TJV29081.1 MAG: glycine amidinotransferase [Mesorhizobium sp.]